MKTSFPASVMWGKPAREAPTPPIPSTARCPGFEPQGLVVIIVQSLSCVQLFVTPWTTACQDSLSIINSQSLLKFMSIESMMPSNRLILCHPLLLLPSIFPSFRAFSSESALHIKWPNITASASASVLSKNIQSEKGYLSSFFCIIPNLLHTTLNWKHLIMIPLSKQLFFRLSFLSSLPGPHFRLYHLLAGRPNHH